MYALSTALCTDLDEAVERVRKALQIEGFGVITEIDMAAVLKAKLGVDMERYLILGACNPALAREALDADRHIGLLLPCNVVVRDHPADAGVVIVEALNPDVMVEVTGVQALKSVADQVAIKLQAALDSLAG
ncbi:DUF302 domain-containing protein [Mycobacteroides abscessus]|uniref:DUF302 domain-containing protein n=1 Tax=Mycobacteroides abscessus TaxID=36809 RepID=UPI0009A7640C|nr:DUF302 domain-containing protein [Mycobacteroides abscessus]MDM2645374.1 DUF302 domain-containing protein [Mycobacteroides abscessus]MDM2654563.1 DUF302 domain-containing protein [Mycobacteroides abscessus]MDM2663954.1 DUF302 domain-containing protein [Mycobacteroides abscessus]MDM2669002.1 DUF302 domain-containing protein [Mycobacteroides abscessus]MDM2672175.1 DUF302 domain-containing protein [Mycobacteroides abscessus]